MGRMYAGKMPDADAGWEHVGTCRGADGMEWLVFSKSQEHAPDWLTYKIVANGRAANKANYWLVRNASTGQIGFARDFAVMRDTRPELHEQVESIIKQGGKQ